MRKKIKVKRPQKPAPKPAQKTAQKPAPKPPQKPAKQRKARKPTKKKETPPEVLVRKITICEKSASVLHGAQNRSTNTFLNWKEITLRTTHSCQFFFTTSNSSQPLHRKATNSQCVSLAVSKQLGRLVNCGAGNWLRFLLQRQALEASLQKTRTKCVLTN